MDNHSFDGHEGGSNNVRRASVRPSLATIPSGIGMDSMAFENPDDILRHQAVVGNARMGPSMESKLRGSLRRLGAGARRLTHEAVPRLANYSNMFQMATTGARPTMEDLHESIVEDKPTERVGNNEPTDNRQKFGWIEGVLIRNMLNIWGVMLFLRISWVVALAGIWQTIIIISISTFVTLVTALSTSAIVTNGEIGGGGTYYVMSRILGPEWGGSIGVLFALANAINASLNVVGFCQTLQDTMKNYGGYTIVDGGDNDTRILGTILMILVWGLCGLGAKYESLTQQMLVVILAVALANFFVGSFLGPQTEISQARGYIGYSLDMIRENWDSGYVFNGGIMQDFFSVFAVYFPAGIGILAGANISGDLKDPSAAIPKGTIWAIIATSISYAIVAIVCAATTVRQATGSIADFRNGTYLDCVSKNCTYGSYNDYQLMTLISAYGPLNYAGCFAATLSTALASYISCPKLLQVIGDDKLYPHWMVGWMTKGYGKSNEPHLAYLFTFFLALGFILIAQLDMIALLISDLFLITFAFLNYACFHVDLVQPVGWRPTFKYYNKWLSLFCACLCIAIMFMIDWRVSLITLACVFLFYFIVLYRKPEVNWGTSSQAMNLQDALTSIQQLVHIEEHVKNYQPQILALTGPPRSRPALVDFAYLICKKNSMLVCGNVVQEKISTKRRGEILQKSYRHLRKNEIKGFCSLIANVDLPSGTSAMLEVVGVGKIMPNILFIGFKNDWRVCDKNSLSQYFATIHAGFNLHVSVAILRVSEGLDYSTVLGDTDEPFHSGGGDDSRPPSVMDSPPGTPDVERHNTISDSPFGSSNNVDTSKDPKKAKKSKKNMTLMDADGNELPRHICNNITRFQKKQLEGSIDVWWLYDDGGLTLLLPYIISTRANWSACQLRVFCTANAQEEVEKEREGMAALLNKFRINYADLVVITDLNKPPKESTKTWFDGLVRPFIRREELTENERLNLQAKTDRHCRLRELVVDHSSDSNLVVMTLPMPRKEAVSAPMYMAWLETLTANMPPFLLVRGNQTSVLTFYA
ncbi:bumetanide-sensitive sodium-(potassium)-chloride cotransporter-like isoform X2 [Daphnia pulicaria]|uniref:bumetanide-sensitive sodium-(potassium)-chloride cotransporter-like isoform X2 n=1 Tax=Daphnia pulicaria TaxID=35523 RepID=UPI001EEC80B8|nr:bumetanide-sensitive sodium-(potassium)-chloride cotransporter-like isoform X2 [Daphnia pulicaria]